jgi:hypothetical protein
MMCRCAGVEICRCADMQMCISREVQRREALAGEPVNLQWGTFAYLQFAMASICISAYLHICTSESPPVSANRKIAEKERKIRLEGCCRAINFDPHQNQTIMSHFISRQTAIDMTTLYRDNYETVLGAAYKGKNILALSETFERSDIDVLLAQRGCTGLRLYYGMNDESQVHAILVGVNEENEDMLGATSLTEEEEEDVILEKGFRCPEMCPPASPLNG